jgi:hypothetical protein
VDKYNHEGENKEHVKEGNVIYILWQECRRKNKEISRKRRLSTEAGQKEETMIHRNDSQHIINSDDWMK